MEAPITAPATRQVTEDTNARRDIGCSPKDVRKFRAPLLSSRRLRSCVELYRLYRGRPVGGAGHRLERGGDDVGVHADAPENLAPGGFSLDVAHRLGIFARAGGVLVIVAHADPDAAILGQCLDI